MIDQIAKLTKYRQETRLEHKHLISLLIGVIAQVVGWAKPDPTTKASATTWESYTQCHLDVGPALGGWLRWLLVGDHGDPKGNDKDEGKCKEKSPGRSSDGRNDWLKMVSEER
jgi:hypothetical protein